MANQLAGKAPTETVERRWLVPVDECDGIASVLLNGSGVTVDGYDIDGREVVITLSGGTAGSVGAITASATTDNGLTLVDTLYVPILATTATMAETGSSICAFALRKVSGIGETADAAEFEDALERLNDMLAMWRIDGLDIGVSLPLTASATLAIPDEYISAIKWNLTVNIAPLYEATLDAVTMGNAEQYRRLVANRLLNLGDLKISHTLTRPGGSVADLF